MKVEEESDSLHIVTEKSEASKCEFQDLNDRQRFTTIDEETKGSCNQIKRNRSSSLGELEKSFSSNDENSMILIKSGILKKKGIIFYNNRVVTLSAKGLLTYYDTKNTKKPRGSINFNDPGIRVSHIISGKPVKKSGSSLLSSND